MGPPANVVWFKMNILYKTCEPMIPSETISGEIMRISGWWAIWSLLDTYILQFSPWPELIILSLIIPVACILSRRTGDQTKLTAPIKVSEHVRPFATLVDQGATNSTETT